MTGIIQSTIENRKLSLIEPTDVPVLPFDVYASGGEKLAKYYADLGAEEENVPLYRATVGSGGATVFDITTGIDALDTTAESICGVIMYAHEMNVFFDEALTGEPPVCTSPDGITGKDRLTGEECSCENCPRNQMKDGRKECRNKVRLYMLTAGTPVPLCLDVPPASLRAWNRYRRSLRHFGFLEPHEILTECTLESLMNPQKKKYCRLKFRMLGKLEPEAVEKINLIRHCFKPDVIELPEEAYTAAEPEGGYAHA